jgi:hypothetical protein
MRDIEIAPATARPVAVNRELELRICPPSNVVESIVIAGRVLRAAGCFDHLNVNERSLLVGFSDRNWTGTHAGLVRLVAMVRLVGLHGTVR